MRFPVRVWVALGTMAAIAAAAGIAYAAIPSSAGPFHACVLHATGSIRMIDPSLSAQNRRSHCASSESKVQWNARGPAGAPGPQGPPGAAGAAGPPGPPGTPGHGDSTVRHISNFIFDGTTVTTPILAARGEVGKLSLFCGSAPDGSKKGVGTITYTTDNTTSARDALTFYSPNVPIPASWQQVNGQASFNWNEPPGDNVVFEMMIEGQIGASDTVRPTLTDIHGFIQHFDFGGCDYYVHVDTSDIASAETFTH